MSQVESLPLWKQEFPEFGEMDVVIPEGFEDASWRNEPCPCFVNSALDACLYVEFRNPEAREFPEVKRFMLIEMEKGQHIGENRREFVHTDDYDG
jgi:hypothetical protein